MTKGSQWTGAVSNIPGSTYNAPAGQFNLTMAEALYGIMKQVVR